MLVKLNVTNFNSVSFICDSDEELELLMKRISLKRNYMNPRNDIAIKLDEEERTVEAEFLGNNSIALSRGKFVNFALGELQQLDRDKLAGPKALKNNRDIGDIILEVETEMCALIVNKHTSVRFEIEFLLDYVFQHKAFYLFTDMLLSILGNTKFSTQDLLSRLFIKAPDGLLESFNAAIQVRGKYAQGDLKAFQIQSFFKQYRDNRNEKLLTLINNLPDFIERKIQFHLVRSVNQLVSNTNSVDILYYCSSQLKKLGLTVERGTQFIHLVTPLDQAYKIIKAKLEPSPAQNEVSSAAAAASLS